MIIDSSAIVAILRNEPEGPHCLRLLEMADRIGVSAGSVIETSVVILRGNGLIGLEDLYKLLDDYGVSVLSVNEVQAKTAGLAYKRYGRGSGNAAKLNFGDCFAYALASERNEPLLFVGDDFTHTDIVSAIPR